MKKIKQKEAQVSFEFTISIVIGMIVLLALLALFANKLHEAVVDSRDKQVTAIFNIIEDELKFAYGVHQGYARIFKIPVSIEGQNYSINITNGFIVISYLGRDYARGVKFEVNSSICLEALNDSTRIFEVRKSGTEEVSLGACPDCVPDFYNCNWNDIRGTCSELATDLMLQCYDRYCLCE